MGTPTANIVFTQSPGGTRAAGEAVEDGVVGNAVTVENEDDTYVGAWKLELVEIPTGPETDSTSVLVKGTFAEGAAPPVSGSFTPDAFDSYLVRLTVNGSITHECAFSCPNERDWSRPPFSADQDNLKYAGQLLGWKHTLDKIHAHVRTLGYLDTGDPKTANYDAHIDELIRVDPSGGAFAITLPTAVGMKNRGITVKNVTTSTNAVTFNTTSSQTIDGLASGADSLAEAWGHVTFISDGANWMRFPKA